MGTQVIVLNGASSAGKSSIARALQDILPGFWLTLGTDTLVEALPASLRAPGAGIEFGPDGEVRVGAAFRELDIAWSRGVAQMIHSGARVIVDEVFLGGVASQARWRSALVGLDALWVGVRCDPAVAEARERTRGDRVPGMARQQAQLVHRGVTYDLTVDTTHLTPLAGAQLIAGHVT